MAVLEDLSPREINEVISSAADKATPVTVTIRLGGRWANLRSRMTQRQGQYLLIEPPVAESGCGCPIAVGQGLGISLKLKHHKYVFQAVAAGASPSDQGPLLALEFPAKMQRLQRRAYLRADVPNGFIVRASFWLGDHATEPSGTSPDRPVWSGRVLNLSAGGYLVRTSDTSSRSVEEGDLIGVRLLFGTGDEAIFADAQVRHVEVQDEQTILGFQFIGMEQTEQGRQSLQSISYHTSEFQRIAYRDELRQASLRGA